MAGGASPCVACLAWRHRGREPQLAGTARAVEQSLLPPQVPSAGADASRSWCTPAHAWWAPAPCIFQQPQGPRSEPGPTLTSLCRLAWSYRLGRAVSRSCRPRRHCRSSSRTDPAGWSLLPQRWWGCSLLGNGIAVADTS